MSSQKILYFSQDSNISLYCKHIGCHLLGDLSFATLKMLQKYFLINTVKTS